MADQAALPCSHCGQVSLFKHPVGDTYYGEYALSCPKCHKMVHLIIQKGKIVGIKKG